ncbi:phage tail tape measure protein [Pelagibacterium sediminicola]|uniref:phage tail tape measure protein n=1 Tax=Pelagibacterium sediminicola TaxID=2248761 RepID=UPI000E310567|nr:phage tail tape measure protein [Pelagibacterium sediminicola]
MSELFGEAFDRELSDIPVELERIRDLGQSVGATLTRSLRGAMMEGRSLRGLLSEIGRAFADIALKAALKPLGTLVSGSIESLFASLNPALGGVKPFAKGGVIGSPTYFPMPGQWGLAGEAGPEAVMPLQRGADGRLGVAGGGAVTVNFNVTASDARSFLAAEAEVNAMLLRAVRRGGRGS